MGATANTGGNKKFYKVVGLKKGTEKIWISENVKDESGKWVNQGEFNALSGYFKSISFGEYEYEGEKKKNLVITLVENGNEFCLSGNFNNLFKGVLNSLSGSGSLGFIEISVGINKGGYPSGWVKNSGERTNWALSVDEQNALCKIYKDDNGKFLSKDDSKLIDKLIELCGKIEPAEGNELNSIGNATNPYEGDVAADLPKEKETVMESDDPDDLPF
tara:strand:+ start:835 stop:1485 length:651 start_codon:yes stop_codon:yes gene_type:complete